MKNVKNEAYRPTAAYTSECNFNSEEDDTGRFFVTCVVGDQFGHEFRDQWSS